MQVVQTPSPWAMVARRWTCRPSIRLIAAVSASHSSGNSWATWETGQCCWHSCSPTGLSRTAAAYPSAVKTCASACGRRELGLGVQQGVEPLLDLGGTSVGELTDGLLAPGLGQEADRLDGEVVVGLVEPVATGLGQGEHLGRATASADRADARLAGLEGALVDQLVEVAAYGGGSQLEALGERHGRGGTVDQDRPYDALARRLVVSGDGLHDFHNTSVPLLVEGIQIRFT